MKKAIVPPKYQTIFRIYEVKKQIYAYHFPDFSPGAVCSFASAQQPASQGQMDKGEGISLKLTATGQVRLIVTAFSVSNLLGQL